MLTFEYQSRRFCWMTLKPAAQHRKSSFSTADSYRIPMPVREILELPNGYRSAVCPRCKCTLDREYQRFCDRCGQHLLWKFFCSATVIKWQYPVDWNCCKELLCHIKTCDWCLKSFLNNVCFTAGIFYAQNFGKKQGQHVPKSIAADIYKIDANPVE